MAEQKQGGGSRKIGRDKAKCLKYRSLHIEQKNKLPRVLQSCGLAFTEKWAADHMVRGLLTELLKRRKVDA